MADKRRIVNAPEILAKIARKYGTQKEFAELLGISQSALSKWQSNDLQPRVEHKKFVEIVLAEGLVIKLEDGSIIVPEEKSEMPIKRQSSKTRKLISSSLTFILIALMGFILYTALVWHEDIKQEFGDHDPMEVYRQRSQKALELCQENSKFCTDADRDIIKQ